MQWIFVKISWGSGKNAKLAAKPSGPMANKCQTLWIGENSIVIVSSGMKNRNWNFKQILKKIIRKIRQKFIPCLILKGVYNCEIILWSNDNGEIEICGFYSSNCFSLHHTIVWYASRFGSAGGEEYGGRGFDTLKLKKYFKLNFYILFIRHSNDMDSRGLPFNIHVDILLALWLLLLSTGAKWFKCEQLTGL